MTEHEEVWANAMRSANRGDADAYARLLSDVARSLRRVIAYDSIRLGLSGSDVEDVLQDTLLAIHLKRHTWDESRPIVPWLRAIAHYKVLDHARKNKRRLTVPVETMAEILPSPEPEPSLSGSAGRFLEILPPRQGVPLSLLMQSRRRRYGLAPWWIPSAPAAAMDDTQLADGCSARIPWAVSCWSRVCRCPF